jgi:hypothetical protein
MEALPQSRSRLFTKARTVYGVGVVVLFATVIVCDVLSPHNRRGESLFVDTLDFPLFVLSLLLCMAAPIYSRRPWPGRLWLWVPAIVGYAFFVVVAMCVSMKFTGFGN